MLNEYFLNIYGRPGTVLGTAHLAVNERDFAAGHESLRINEFSETYTEKYWMLMKLMHDIKYGDPRLTMWLL